jgi:hypothetical protein
MKLFSRLFCQAFVLASSISVLSAAGAGFQEIFNGKDLMGWDGNLKLWSVQEGAITGQTTAESPIKENTFLVWTNGIVGDFELRFTYRIIGGNSGVQYRSEVMDPAKWIVGGYQADIEAGTNYSGILYEERKSLAIMAVRGEKVVWDKEGKKQVIGWVGDSNAIQAAIKSGDWNDYVIIAKGNHLQHFINGKQTVDVIDDTESKRASTGVLALQVHVGPPMKVQFKDMRIKKL